MNDIDKHYLLTPKIIYYSLASVYYAIQYFRVTFCEKYFGFTTAQAGNMAAMMALSGFLLTPLISLGADRFSRHQTVLILLVILAAASFELLLVRWTSPSLQYYYALGIFTAYGAFLGGILPLTDYQTLKLLTVKFGVGKDLYGRQRMMGTVAFSLTSWIVGVLLDKFSPAVLFYFIPILSTVASAVLLLVAYPDEAGRREPAPPLEKEKLPNPSTPTSSTIAEPTPSVWVFFKSFNFVFFLLTVLITGCGRQIIQSYLANLLRDNLGLKNSVAGASVIYSSILSVVFLFFGANIIAFFGVPTMLVLGMVTMGVRVGLHVFVRPSAWAEWIVYAIEVLNGIAFGFTHLAGVRFAADFAPKGLETTAQSLYLSFYMSLPAVLGAFFGGQIYHEYGGIKLFRLTSLLILSSSVVVGVKFFLDGSFKLFRRR